MTYDITEGTTYLFPVNYTCYKAHLHIVLINPDNEQNVMVVHITSLATNPNPDTTVVITAAVATSTATASKTISTTAAK